MKTTLLRGLFAVLLLQLAAITGAHAQATRTWVSGVGDDVNPCSRTAPCKTFAGAISKTAAGGIINCLDPGGFGAVTITKSITIDCEGTLAGILASGTTGVVINAAGSVVNLRNLSIEGAGTTPGVVGVSFINGASLTIDHCKIFGFTGSTARGVSFTPPAGVAAKLQISDTIISDNGNAATNGGIVIAPVGTGSVLANFQRVVVTRNTTGIRGTTTAGGGNVRVAMADSQVGGNSSNGVNMVAPAGGALSLLSIHQSSINGNGSSGVLVDGASSGILLSNSMVTANNIGLQSVNSGGLLSIKNSMVSGNISIDGTTTAATPQ